MRFHTHQVVQSPCFQHIKKEEFKICVELHLNTSGGVHIIYTNIAFLHIAQINTPLQDDLHVRPAVCDAAFPPGCQNQQRRGHR